MPAHSLTWEEADRWVRELETDWDAVRRADGIGTLTPQLKKRWREGGAAAGGSAPNVQKRVRKVLESLEKKKPTKFGQAIMALEEWMALGAKIAQSPDDFLLVTDQLRRLAGTVEKKSSGKSTVEIAEAQMEDLMAPFRAQVPSEPTAHNEPPSRAASGSRARSPSLSR